MYSSAQSPKVTQLHWSWLAHPVQFKPASATLSKDEILRLDRFLSGVMAKPEHRVLIDFGGEGDLNPLTQERIQIVTRQLNRHLPGVVVQAYSGSETPPHGVRVLVGHYLVKTPDCPDWSRPSGSNPGNMRDGNFGCATAVNLGLMVADPSDLQQGRSLAPGDGQVLSEAIRRYRTDSVKDPVAPSVTSSASE